MYKRLLKLTLAVFSIFLATFAGATLYAMEAANGLEIKKIDIEQKDSSTLVTIRGTIDISGYESKTVEKAESAPARMFVDIENAVLNKDIPNVIPVGSLVEKIRLAHTDKGVRIVFDSALDSLFKYSILPVDRGIRITLSDPAAAPAKPGSAEKKAEDAIGALIEDSVAVAESKSVAGASLEDEDDAYEDSFSLSGFKKDKINIDFYKADLHNVFRFFREISNQNMIVDKGVKGTITISLNDVPWDFALDIILNLSNLEKEERFNTIVIYPKKKKFVWPERTSIDNLEIETDQELLDQETLIVEQADNTPREIMEAKEALRIAKLKEKSGDYEEAAHQYEKALELWKDNARIANRLATLYLANLKNNAKAIYFARKSLQIKADNPRAALYAAIASANMEKRADAIEYFNQSVSSSPPMKEALLSYAAFSENTGNLDSAFDLLTKYNEFYGDTAQTMLSKARILDNQGKTKEANAQYNMLLNSGFAIRPDLKKYIMNRLAPITNE